MNKIRSITLFACPDDMFFLQYKYNGRMYETDKFTIPALIPNWDEEIVIKIKTEFIESFNED